MTSSLEYDFLAAYWSAPEIATNIIVFLNLAGALILGLIVGYERSYNGRAAGMRTYGLVCVASAALTVVAGYPGYWYGGHVAATGFVDPTRVIQGIVTGVGFLGAGVIVKDGTHIRGLTTAASIWASSAIGVLVGVGFYAAAILLTFLSAGTMHWISRLENWLPSHPSIAISIQFTPNFVPDEERLSAFAFSRGYVVAAGSVAISFEDGSAQWRFIAAKHNKSKAMAISELANQLARFDGVKTFSIAHARS